MEKIINFKENIVITFIVFVILYFLILGIFYRPSTYPVILKVTQDSLCLTPQGWPMPCPELIK
jgi:hypothetical protein